MSGVTDEPFRRIVRRFGVGLVVSEMIASAAMVQQAAKEIRAAGLPQKYLQPSTSGLTWTIVRKGVTRIDIDVTSN